MRRESGKAGVLLLLMLLGVALVGYLVYQLYLKPRQAVVSDVDGVKVERNINSVERANQVIQDTKKTLEDQAKNAEERLKKQLEE